MKEPFSDSPYHDEAVVARQAVRRAGDLCRSVQAGIDLGTLEKKDRSPVTIADFGSQALVCRALAEMFSDDPIIGEENAAVLLETGHAATLARVVDHVRAIVPEATAATVCDWIDRGGRRETAPRFWTLDPIDGTKGFLRGEQYAVALALIENGALKVAAMACPNLGPSLSGPRGAGTVFTAVVGEGVWATPMVGAGNAVRVAVSNQADPAGLRFCESVEAAHSSHDDAARIASRLGVTAPSVRVDSQVKYGVTCRGEADVYLRLPRNETYREKIWDHAAGALVLTEAGGRVTDLHGRDLDFSQGYRLEENRGVIVSNGLLHEAVLAAIRDLGIGSGAGPTN